MPIINLFLQKRKMHESSHGLLMIVTAYVLSVMMLVMGSDIFYNINSTAAGFDMETEEETHEIVNELLPGLPTTDLTSPLVQSELVKPYAFAEVTDTGLGEALAQNIPQSGDMIWLLGSGMSYEEYDSAMEQMNNLVISKGTEQTVATTVKETNAKATTIKETAVEETEAKETADVTKSLSTKETESSTFMAVTEKEVDMLERIVEAEATGEDMIGKILIANVVFNRVADEEFPDTLKEVIFQNVNGDYQFSPVSDERYWSVEVTDETIEAVQRALQGEDYSEGALYFIARKRTNSNSAKWFDQHLDWLFKHGGHEFYKNK